MRLRAPGSTPPMPFDSCAALVAWLCREKAVERIAHALGQGRRVVASGAVGSSTVLLAGALAKVLDGCVVLVTAHLDDAEEAEEELRGAGVEVARLPAGAVMEQMLADYQVMRDQARACIRS